MNKHFWNGSFLIGFGLFATVGCHTTGTVPSERNITGVFLDVANIHHDAKSNGDTWDYI